MRDAVPVAHLAAQAARRVVWASHIQGLRAQTELVLRPEPDGTRVDTRNAEGYYQAWIDFVREGRLHGPYGAATIIQPKRAPRR